ncbi:hypothetical protein [Mucilaginibacter pocheonensis]|uniref:Na+-transporting methylmalonyl-CoA/oxaloacetate decarboxylase gamma subunit n=1 Tax=Mucilaginibacter pocheonensis TaxID=398050 RepID=A0ABU1TDJ5_9SPHI|nr:hypothetical protein [Mucilaginibacter pocheonensis]MDR6943464.1 Na+-transporting methylmalonyl-CoA/oxaloacetate decarboxylase gamma subunit [Mucilaginibacter pocheonensis]
MLVALMKIFIFLCILIVPLRGPSRRREVPRDSPETITTFSNYGVNEQGRLEIIDEEDNT